MLCPKCNQKMVILVRPDGTVFQDGSEHVEVLGRCEDCDFDATWEIVTDVDDHTHEFNLKRYFFG
jgi:hypothetical protein